MKANTYVENKLWTRFRSPDSDVVSFKSSVHFVGLAIVSATAEHEVLDLMPGSG